MAIDPNIKKKADDIRNKVYGQEVRESLASGLEEMSSDVIENEGRQSVVEGRQDSVESQWQNVVDETTGKDVISAPEIIAARNGESNLKARLDKEKNEVTAQLDQITINVKDFGAVGDGVANDTQAFKDAFAYKVSNDLRTVYVPKGVYMVDTYLEETNDALRWNGNIFIPSNTELILHPEAIVKAVPNDQERYNIFTLQDVENVSIKGGHIQGERNEHMGTTGEWGYGIALKHAVNVLIEDVKITDCWGDGIDINGGLSTANEESKNVTIRNVLCDNNRRQGMSIEAVIGCLVENSTFINTGGIAPEAGIDIEPWTPDNVVSHVEIRNCYFGNNNGSGLVVMGESVEKVKIDFCVFENNKGDEGQMPFFFCSDIIASNNYFTGIFMGGITRVNNISLLNNSFDGILGVVNSSVNVLIENNHVRESKKNVYEVLSIPNYQNKNLSRNIIIRKNKVYSEPEVVGVHRTRRAFEIASGTDITIEDNEIRNTHGAIYVGEVAKEVKIINNRIKNTKLFSVDMLSNTLIAGNIFTGANYGNPGEPVLLGRGNSKNVIIDNIAYTQPQSSLDEQPAFAVIAASATIGNSYVYERNTVVEG